uniref:Stum, mechanosensory transduction mediator homolog n=1 Tax=Apteryx owenii TaxID=8824 RepID=A0A8B9QCG5_APTOW
MASFAACRPAKAAAAQGCLPLLRQRSPTPLRRAGTALPPTAFTGCFIAALSVGTFVSAFTVLCGARTDLPDRHMCCVFWLNIAAALIQILTAIVMVGWIMSIFWGMDMVILASKYSALPLPPLTSPPLTMLLGLR